MAAGQPDSALPPARSGASEPTSPSVLAVDGTALLVRCSRAGARMGLSAADGTPTGTLTAFIGSLARRLREHRPDYAVIAWDGPGAGDWRKEICPEYKLKRRPAPDAPDRLVRDFCSAAGIRQLWAAHFEADDILAAVWRRVLSEMPEARLTVMTDDSDLLQLTGDGRTVVEGLGHQERISKSSVSSAWGADPWRLPCLRALAGDPSDGIPGLPGVGPVGALGMLRDARFAWPLPESVLKDKGQRRQAENWHKVMELVNPVRRPEHEESLDPNYFRLADRAEWRREPRGTLRVFLAKYQLAALSERLGKGELW